MTDWTTRGKVYSWVVQLGCILVTLSLRRFLILVVLASIKDFPVFYLRILWYLLGLGICAVLWQLFQELEAATIAFSYFVMGEWLLIITQFYLLVSLAAPVCSVEGYRFIFKGIDITETRQIKTIIQQHSLKQCSPAALQRVIRGGYGQFCGFCFGYCCVGWGAGHKLEGASCKGQGFFCKT